MFEREFCNFAEFLIEKKSHSHSELAEKIKNFKLQKFISLLIENWRHKS